MTLCLLTTDGTDGGLEVRAVRTHCTLFWEPAVFLPPGRERGVSRGLTLGQETGDMALNYSREDLEVLLTQAERLVRSSNCGNLREKHCEDGTSSDSDYETRASRDILISSEPNIPLRRLSPNRKSRRDWRNSLPECLEFFNNPRSEPESGRESQISLPLSELWEHDSFLSEHVQEGDTERATLPHNLANFGEDYHKFLYSDLSESDSSDLEERSRDRHSNTSYRILQSKSSLKDLLIQLNTNSDLWNCQKELVSCSEY